MEKKWRIVRLLMWKNYLTRKRYWKQILILQILIPLCMFLLVQKLRSIGPTRKEMDNVTYYPIDTKESLLGFDDFLLFYVPENNFTRKLMNRTTECLLLPPQNVTGFPSEEIMLKNYSYDHGFDYYGDKILAVIFKQTDDEPEALKHLDYTLRSSYDTPTNLLGGVFQDYNFYYVKHLFLTYIPYAQTQMCIDESFINMSAPNPSFLHKVTIQRMPNSGQVKLKTSDEATGFLFATGAIVIFLSTLLLEAFYSASEKYTGVNILMGLNGVQFHINLCSCLGSGILYGLFYATGIIIVMTQAFNNPILFYGNSFIIWIFLVFHIAHLTAFGMHITAYFSNSVTLQFILLILYAGSSLFQAYLIDSYVYSIIPFLGIIFPNILLFRMFQEMNMYETLVMGVQWTNMFQIADSAYCAAGSIGFMIIFSIMGTALHFFLCLYIHIIFPGKFGLRQHPLYFLQTKAKVYEELDEELDEFSYANVEGKPFEIIPKGVFTPGIQIRNIKKSYRTNWLNKTETEALHGISMDIYKGQITTILGRNGAGKTTMMSILTGLCSPNEGVVLIDGKRISDYFETLSTDLNFCPQENMFFPHLTVIEQMEFFGMLKCINKTTDEKMLGFHIDKLLKRLNIYEKRNCFPKEMSGSQQRSLCIGLSFMNDAKILILDEPTSGMDSESKKDTWNMLLELKGERTILISTKDTEEANVLSDKIAILHSGTLKGYGTSVFLKKLYGQGNIEVTLTTTTWRNAEAIRQELGSNNELLNLEDEMMVLCVPYTEQLAESIDRIENKKRELGVTAINVSLITLEQVFLKVTKKEQDIDLTRPFINLSYKLKNRELLLQTIFALVEKNFIHTRRNMCTFLSIMILPLISILFMVMNYSSINAFREFRESKYLSLDLYNNPLVMLSSNNESLSEKLRMFVKDSDGSVIDIPHVMLSSNNESLQQSLKMFNKDSGGIVSDGNIIESSGSLNNELVAFSEKDVSTFRNNLVSAIEFNVTGKSVNANALYSETALLSIPIGLNIISNVMIKSLVGEDYEIKISDHILPQLRSFSEYDLSAIALLFTCFLYPAVALFVIQPWNEVSSGIKHLQRMAGVSSLTYWSIQFAVDFIVFFISIILCLIGFYLMDCAVNLELYRSTELAIMTLLLMLFAANALPIAYIFSFVQMPKSTIVTSLSLFPLVLLAIEGFFWIIEWEMQPYFTIEGTNETYVREPNGFLSFREVQKRIFQLIPHISFFHAQVSFLITGVGNAHCQYLSRQQIAEKLISEYCKDLECSNGICRQSIPYFRKYPKYSTAEINLNECVIYLCLTPFIYFAILAAIEHGLLQRVFARLLNKKPFASNEEVDDQVREEKYSVGFEVNKLKADKASKKANKLVSETSTEGDNAFLVHELNKCYKSKQIVRDVNFSVKSGECFGLLGVNGAGKSTIFKILTGCELPDRGDMFLRGYDIFTERKEYLSQMGYCPQNTALIYSLNAREHLRLFARIRGIPRNQVDLEVEEWINRLHLSECASEPCGTYSVGNKRCLNIAIAFIGNPDLVLLDEPTTGIDPESRKSLWNMIKSFLRAGQSAILTSNSLEECEALCNRLAIMAKGRLVCIGPSHELKQRFDVGYNINIEINPERTQAQVEAITSDIENALNCETRGEHLGHITYYVTNSKTPWKTMYDLMKRLKYKYPCIVDFTILSATLEQVFLRFAKTDGN